MRIPMPAAVLIGGASRRMGRPKAALAYGAGTLAEFQAVRLSEIFEDVFLVAKEKPTFPVGPSRVVLDGVSDHAAMHGLVRALEEVPDRVFVLAVDLPAIPNELVRLIARRGLASPAAAVLPSSAGRLQPLAGVWRRAALEPARRRVARGELALAALAQDVGAEVLDEEAWRAIDPAGAAFTNLNTLEDYAALRERA